MSSDKVWRIKGMDEKTIEKIQEIQSAVLMINVDKGDSLDKKYKELALELLSELLKG
jgi:hypothetical protein